MGIANACLGFACTLLLLTLFILLLDLNLIIHLGVCSTILNLIDILLLRQKEMWIGEIAKDPEIMMFRLYLCFIGCDKATKQYEELNHRGEESMKQIQGNSLQTTARITNIVDTKDTSTKNRFGRAADIPMSSQRN